MNYATENSTTKTENGLVESLTRKNAQGIAEMQKDAMPVMVPVQEKNWDTMVSLLQSTVNFQPKMYELMDRLLTVSKMESMMEAWSKAEQEHYEEALKETTYKLSSQQTAVEIVLLQMQDLEKQVGNRLEKIMKDTLEQGKELEKAIAMVPAKSSRRTWIIRTVISVGASVLAAALSTLLCVLWLV